MPESKLLQNISLGAFDSTGNGEIEVAKKVQFLHQQEIIQGVEWMLLYKCGASFMHVNLFALDIKARQARCFLVDKRSIVNIFNQFETRYC